MKNELSIAFIGGCNRAAALASGLAGKVCAARHIHVIDINQDARARWMAPGMTTAATPGAVLERCGAGVFAGAPRNIEGVAASTRQWLHDAMGAGVGFSRGLAREFQE